MEIFKVCTKCGEEKFIQNFTVSKYRYTNVCKKCTNIESEKYRAKKKAEREAKKESDRQHFEDIRNGKINFDHWYK